MDILGIGPLELIFIFILVLIVLGPNEMVKTGRTIGTFIGNLVRSDFWKAFQTASNEISSLPHKLAREAEFAELKNEIAPEGARSMSTLEDELKLEGWVTPHQETTPQETEPADSTDEETAAE